METALRKQGQVDNNTQPEIEESIRGVRHSFVYTGRRQAPKSRMIELHITSTITDWAPQSYTRKLWYMGHSKNCKKCIEDHLRHHLLDMSAGPLLMMRLMQDFEVREEHFQEWERYNPTHFRS